MDLRECVYSVLIVSASESFRASTKEMLPPARYQPVFEAGSVSEAKRQLDSRNIDFVIINTPLPDEFGTRFAMECCNSASTVVLILFRPDVHDEVYEKMEERGVFTLTKPTSHAMMTQALKWMASGRERLRRLEKKTSSIEERMGEIRLLNRAKMTLMAELHMTEEEAHHCLERMAMDKCITKKAAAEEIIKEYAS